MKTATPLPEALPLSRDSVYWQVIAEPVVIAAGGRALLMQVAHPGVGAGVAQHSSYAKDPWGRFFRTMDIMMKLSFGTPEESARQQRVLATMHRRVLGETDEGTRYSALDTDLQLWVWATLVDTALLAYEQVRPPLGDAARERYYAESKLMAYGCGVERGACPDRWEDFCAYVDCVVAEDLRVTASARAVATASMVPPLPKPLALLATAPHQLITVGLMPVPVREQYGYRWDARRQGQLDRLFAVGRLGGSVLPRPLRQLNAAVTVSQKHALRVPWLQRRGAELTERRLREAGHAA